MSNAVGGAAPERPPMDSNRTYSNGWNGWKRCGIGRSWGSTRPRPNSRSSRTSMSSHSRADRLERLPHRRKWTLLERREPAARASVPSQSVLISTAAPFGGTRRNSGRRRLRGWGAPPLLRARRKSTKYRALERLVSEVAEQQLRTAMNLPPRRADEDSGKGYGSQVRLSTQSFIDVCTTLPV